MRNVLLTMPNPATTLQAAVETAFAECSLIPDSMCLMGNFHTLDGCSFGLAFVWIVVGKCFFAVLELVPVPATDATQLKIISILLVNGRLKL